MILSTNIHLEEGTRVEVAPVGFKDVVVRLDDEVRLFFGSTEHLRNFAESLLKQLDLKEEQSA